MRLKLSHPHEYPSMQISRKVYFRRFSSCMPFGVWCKDCVALPLRSDANGREWVPRCLV